MSRLALQNLLCRPVRTTLAILGMLIAIFAMVGLFSVSAGLDDVIRKTINRVPGLIAMQRGAPIPIFSSLPRNWMTEIEQTPGIRAAYSECWGRVNVIDSQVIVSPPRLMCGTDIPRRLKLETSVVRDDVKAGRFLTVEDIGTYHAVIGKPIAEQFKKKVGDEIEVNGAMLKIVGIYETGSLLLDVCIFIDQDIFREITRFDYNSVSCFYMEQDGTRTDDQIADEINEKFRHRASKAKTNDLAIDIMSGKNPVSAVFSALDRNLKGNKPQSSAPAATSLSADHKTAFAKKPATAPSSTSAHKTVHDEHRVEDSPMEIRPAMQWVSRFDSLTEELDIFLGLLTIIGLVIAVVCILNTMLMSVTERMTEFGILRANGWTRWDLLKLVAFESGIMGFAGGVLGSAAGWLGVQLVNYMMVDRLRLVCHIDLMLTGILMSTLLGVLGGLYPAWWVTKMSPMQAIRRG
jgi:putative ABC transport system permease protein